MMSLFSSRHHDESYAAFADCVVPCLLGTTKARRCGQSCPHVSCVLPVALPILECKPYGQHLRQSSQHSHGIVEDEAFPFVGIDVVLSRMLLETSCPG